MKIYEVPYKWNSSLENRSETNYIILHHRGGNGDVNSIHDDHKKRGWAGIGYHFYVRKDGSVYRGRPLDAVGAHCTNFNYFSIGICFEGNFENDKMTDLQLTAGINLVKELKEKYPDAIIKGHDNFMKTKCPGKNFPIEVFENIGFLTTANDITWELNNTYFEIQDTEKFVKELNEAKEKNSSLYWGYYKLVNKRRR